jgi:hypothetical protein
MTVPFDTPVESERRSKMPPVPTDYQSLLNSEQQNALRNVEGFGWELAFVRRPLFQDPVFIVFSPDHQQHAVIEIDGEINRQPDIALRR